MADDQTIGGNGAESNSSSAPEPVILEEIIVGPAPKKEIAQPPQPPAAAAVSIPPAAKPAVSTPTPAPLAPQFNPPAPLPSAPPQETVPDVGLLRPTPPATPVARSQPPVSPPPSTEPKELKTDIAHILKDIHLPERRAAQGAQTAESAKAPRTFDTSLVGQALGALSDTAPAAPPAAPTAPTSSGTPAQTPPTPAAISVPPTTPAPQSVETKGSVVAFHTLKDDLQHVVRDQKISVVRAVSLEAERKHRAGTTAGAPDTFTPPAETQRAKRTFGILFAVVLLLALGGAALGGVYLIAQQRGSNAPTPSIESILFAESTVALPLSGKSPTDLKRILGGARTSTTGALGSITRVVPTIASTNPDGTAGNRAATLEEFLKAIASGAPDDLIRAAGKDFFFGIHTVDKNAPLLVVPITSYDRAFAAMLAWEPLMNASLAPVFTPLPAQTLDANGLPTLRTFQDVIMRNYDARALKDDTGDVQLYYSFPTQSILIIAESPYSFAEILSRLQAERRL